MSEKLGWFKFYPGDWARDLEEHPPEIEGYWIRICCKLSWEPERGRALKNLEQWARVMRVIDLKEASRVLCYLRDAGIADVAGDPRQEGAPIAIVSRRMVRDERERRGNALRQERHRRKTAPGRADEDADNAWGNGDDNGGLTPQSEENEESEENSPPAPAGVRAAARHIPKLATALGDQGHELHGLAQWFAEKLWAKYPPRRGRKQGKAEAWEWLARKRPPPDQLERMEAKLDEDLASDDWRRGIGIKDCQRWLKANQKNGWEFSSAPARQGDDPYEGLDD